MIKLKCRPNQCGTMELQQNCIPVPLDHEIVSSLLLGFYGQFSVLMNEVSRTGNSKVVYYSNKLAAQIT